MDTIRRKFIEALKATNTSEIIEQMDRDGELEKIFPHIVEVKKIRDRKSTRLNSSHIQKSRMPSSA